MEAELDYKTPATPPCEDGVETPMSIAELDEEDILDLDISNPNPSSPSTTRYKQPPLTPEIVDLSEEPDGVSENDVIILSSDNEEDAEIDFQPEITFTPLQNYPNKDHEEVIISKRRLSNVQQVKFLQYCEATSAQFQKDYIKWKNREAEAEAVNNQNVTIEENEYLITVLQNFKRLIDFIWLTIDWNCKDTANLLPKYYDSNSKVYEKAFSDIQDLGQVSILLKLADDLLTMICKFKIIDATEDQSVFQWIFKVFYILDYIFMILAADMKANGINSLMKVTESIRLKPILERSRIELTNWFKECKINKYRYELSKIYENSLYKL
ncbi:hypothetical protein QEN19_003164 [Hanseniaspora menglaensis]